MASTAASPALVRFARLRTVTEITLPCAKCRKPVETGLRPHAVGNFISITVLTARPCGADPDSSEFWRFPADARLGGTAARAGHTRPSRPERERLLPGPRPLPAFDSQDGTSIRFAPRPRPPVDLPGTRAGPGALAAARGNRPQCEPAARMSCRRSEEHLPPAVNLDTRRWHAARMSCLTQRGTRGRCLRARSGHTPFTLPAREARGAPPTLCKAR